jgi:hypothetical protein
VCKDRFNKFYFIQVGEVMSNGKRKLIVTVAVVLSVGSVGAVSASMIHNAEVRSFQEAAGAQPRLENKGESAEIETIKTQAKKLIEAGNLMSNQKPEVQKAIGADPKSPEGEKLRADLAKVWSPQKAEESFNEIVALFRKENGMAMDQTFDTGEFVIQDWQGVQVDGNQALVRVIGHWESRKGGQVLKDVLTQWSLTLERQLDNGTWLMVDRLGVSLEPR